MSGVTDTTPRPYPLIPQLDWLRELADDLDEDGQITKLGYLYNPEEAEKVRAAYWYIVWSRRTYLVPHTENKEVNEICFWMMIKYHRILFDIPLTPAEEGKVEEAYKNHKRRIAAFKAARKQ